MVPGEGSGKGDGKGDGKGAGKGAGQLGHPLASTERAYWLQSGRQSRQSTEWDQIEIDDG